MTGIGDGVLQALCWLLYLSTVFTVVAIGFIHSTCITVMSSLKWSIWFRSFLVPFLKLGCRLDFILFSLLYVAVTFRDRVVHQEAFIILLSESSVALPYLVDSAFNMVALK